MLPEPEEIAAIAPIRSGLADVAATIGNIVVGKFE
jgi:hypothetical protein